MKKSTLLPANSICFGLDRATDEKSIAAFSQRFARQDLLDVLVPKLDDHEIEGLLECMSSIMAKHLTEGQYHKLFLADS